MKTKLSIKDKKLLTSEDISRCLFKDDYKNKLSSIYYYIVKLTNDGTIEKVGRNKYKVLDSKKQKYVLKISDTLNKISHDLKKQFPELDFCLWESVALNEFLNHQISENTIFLEVENKTVDFVFSYLSYDLNYKVLVKPSKTEFDRYFENDVIILNRLISEAPTCKKNNNLPTIEKLMVDILANKYLDIANSELNDIYAEIFTKYFINLSTVNRYAARRNKQTKINEYLDIVMNAKLEDF